MTAFLSLYQVVGVAQAINKKSGNGGTFTEKDEKVPKLAAGVVSSGRCFLFRVYRPLELAVAGIVDHKNIRFKVIWNGQKCVFPMVNTVLTWLLWTCGIYSVSRTVWPRLPQALCVSGPHRGCHGLQTHSFTFHHCYKGSQPGVKCPKAVLQVHRSRSAKNWNCLPVKQLAVFYKLCTQTMGRRGVDPGWVVGISRRKERQPAVFYIPLLIQLWRHTSHAPCPHVSV